MTIRVGIAGLGTVGLGTYTILNDKASLLAKRAGNTIIVTAVASRTPDKDRGVDLSHLTWHTNSLDLAQDDNVDVVVEAIGGEKGIAYDLVKASLERGKHVVTANKALIAVHGQELLEIAENNNVALLFEAAVAGGIPILKALREGMAANDIRKVYGIMNGTCNYILTAMRETRQDFDPILAEAQAKGYAETPPDLDVDGIDTAHKLTILSSLAYGTTLAFNNVYSEGIRDITLHDIDYAAELGYRIKLLGVAQKNGDTVSQRVHPCLVKAESQIGQVEDVLNAVVVENDSLGTACLTGAGAGAGPTASAVVADIIDIAADRASGAFGIPVKQLQHASALSMDNHEGCYYLRLSVEDQDGVLSKVSSALSEHHIGVDQIMQKPVQNGAHIALITHKAVEKDIKDALISLEKASYCLQKPQMIRIEV